MTRWIGIGKEICHWMKQNENKTVCSIYRYSQRILIRQLTNIFCFSFKCSMPIKTVVCSYLKWRSKLTSKVSLFTCNPQTLRYKIQFHFLKINTHTDMYINIVNTIEYYNAKISINYNIAILLLYEGCYIVLYIFNASIFLYFLTKSTDSRHLNM